MREGEWAVEWKKGVGIHFKCKNEEDSLGMCLLAKTPQMSAEVILECQNWIYSTKIRGDGKYGQESISKIERISSANEL